MAKVKDVSVEFSENNMLKDRPSSELMTVSPYYLRIKVMIPCQADQTRVKMDVLGRDLKSNPAGKNLMKQYQGKMVDILKELEKEVQDLSDADARGDDTKAFSKAKQLAKQADAQLDQCVARLREALKKNAMKVAEAKKFMVGGKPLPVGSPGSATVSGFKGIFISLAAFVNAEPEMDDSSGAAFDEDLAKAFKDNSNEWLFCAYAANAKEAMFCVNKKGNEQVKPDGLRELRKAVGGSASTGQPALFRANGTKVDFCFFTDKKPSRVVLKSGMKKQVQGKFKLENVFVTDKQLPSNKTGLKKFDPAGDPAA